MKCTWCKNEATQGGRAPAGTVGLLYALGCDVHREIIKKLGYEPMDPAEIRMAMKREQKEAKK